MEADVGLSLTEKFAQLAKRSCVNPSCFVLWFMSLNIVSSFLLFVLYVFANRGLFVKWVLACVCAFQICVCSCGMLAEWC